MSTLLLRGLCITLFLAPGVMAQSPLPWYAAADLGRVAGYANATMPRGLNDFGTVVGNASASNGVQRAFVCVEGGAIAPLPLPPGASAFSSTIAVDVNNAGQVAGFTDSPAQVWVYDLSIAQYTMITMPAGQSGGEPAAINNLGQVVGWTADSTNLRSFFWSAATGALDPTGGLTYARLTDINDEGLIVGAHNGLAKSWDRPTGQVKIFPMLEAPYDDSAVIESVNGMGIGTGWCRWIGSSSQNTVRRAFRSDDAGVVLQGLDAVSGALADAGRAINDAGFIVGTTGTTASNSAYQHAWVMAPAGEREFLDAKVTAAGVWDNFEGTFARINSRGQIIVMGTLLSGLDRSSRGVLLTPVAACGTADFNGDGDFGTDQDIEAFFACLAGSCCAACFEGGSDFNADGDFGTDQDIESFFRVLAGGGC